MRFEWSKYRRFWTVTIVIRTRRWELRLVVVGCPAKFAEGDVDVLGGRHHLGNDDIGNDDNGAAATGGAMQLLLCVASSSVTATIIISNDVTLLRGSKR
jgi:hypothetical protein